MEKSSEEKAAAEPADSVGEGVPSSVAGGQAARPEDHVTLLLRLFSSGPLGRNRVRLVAQSSAFRYVWPE